MSSEVFPAIITAELRMIPGYREIVKIYTGGQEQRDQRWLFPRFRFELAAEPLVLQVLWSQLDAFYHRHRGRHETFLFQDWTVSPATGAAAKNRTGEELGRGNGSQTVFYLYENRVDAAAIYKDGVLQVQGPTPDVVVELTTGKVTFTVAPAANARITADVTNAYFRVRFDMDEAEWDRVRGAGWRGRIALVQPNRAAG